MSPEPTGEIIRTDGRLDLVLVRDLPVPIADVWAGLTRPEITGRWFASWSGDARPGMTIRCTLTGEEGAPADIDIEVCEPPRHLAVRSVDEYGSWHTEVTLEERGESTRLAFVHHLDDDTDVGSIAPGWEYYLDRLGAVLLAGPEPHFEDYYPAQQAYYQNR